MIYPVWSFPSKNAFLLDKTIHIWRIQFSHFTGNENSLLQALNNEEQKRADQFHYNLDRN